MTDSVTEEYVSIPWAIAKGALDQGSRGLQQVRAYTLMFQASYRGRAVWSDVRALYKAYGVNRTQAWKELVAVTQSWAPAGQPTQLATIVGRGRNVVFVRRPAAAVCDELGMRNMGFVSIPKSELRSLPALRRSLYQAVAFTRNTNADDSVTISRAGLRKLTGVSTRTQQRYEQQLAIVVRENITLVHFARRSAYQQARTMRELGGQRVDDGHIQIRNSYFAAVESISHASATDYVHRESAASAKRFYPELGQYATRQCYTDHVPTLKTARAVLAQGLNLDIYIGTAVDTATGTVLGRYGRLLHDEPYSDSDLQSILTGFTRYDRYYAAQGHVFLVEKR